MIYLDNAATTNPKPKMVMDAVKNSLKYYCANPGRSGHSISENTAIKIYECRLKIAEMFGCRRPESVVFTPNCTTAINYALKGTLKAGDHVITSDIEHNAIARPLHNLQKHGVDYDKAVIDFYDTQKTIENFENLIKQNTKLIAVTHSSNVLGITLPIAELGELCVKNNIKLLVDAAQTAGVLPIDMNYMNIDFLCIAPHKGLYAPMGTGILISPADCLNDIIQGGTGNLSAHLDMPDELPEQLEAGTVNVPGIMGINAGVDFVNKIGIKNIHLKEIDLISEFYSKISRYDKIELYTKAPNRYCTPVLSFNIKDVSSSKLAFDLNKAGIATRAGLHCAPWAHKKIGTTENGTVRISPSYFNTEEQMYRLTKFIFNY